MQAIQVAGAEAHVVAHLDTHNERRRKAMLRDTVLTSTVNSLSATTVSIGTGLVLVLAALSVHSAHLGPGDLALFISYLGSIGEFVGTISSLIAQTAQPTFHFSGSSRCCKAHRQGRSWLLTRSISKGHCQC